MSDALEIRLSGAADLPAIEALHADAFPDEDLVPLVRALLRDVPTILSIVAITQSALVGHVIFTRCSIAGYSCAVALLGPLAVASVWQGQGIGSALVRDGLQRLGGDGVSQVFVLGDPAYYGRFGFLPETNVMPPYPLPAEWRTAWQSLGLGKTEVSLHGVLVVPATWRRPELWGP